MEANKIQRKTNKRSAFGSEDNRPLNDIQICRGLFDFVKSGKPARRLICVFGSLGEGRYENYVYRRRFSGWKNCVGLQYSSREVVSDSFNFIGRCNSSAPNVDERQADEQLFS